MISPDSVGTTYVDLPIFFLSRYLSRWISSSIIEALVAGVPILSFFPSVFREASSRNLCGASQTAIRSASEKRFGHVDVFSTFEKLLAERLSPFLCSGMTSSENFVPKIFVYPASTSVFHVLLKDFPFVSAVRVVRFCTSGGRNIATNCLATSS